MVKLLAGDFGKIDDLGHFAVDHKAHGASGIEGLEDGTAARAVHLEAARRWTRLHCCDVNERERPVECQDGQRIVGIAGKRGRCVVAQKVMDPRWSTEVPNNLIEHVAAKVVQDSARVPTLLSAFYEINIRRHVSTNAEE